MAASMKPYADDEASVTVGGITIENGTDLLNISGSLNLAKDRQRLDHVRALHGLLAAIVVALEAEPDLPARAAKPKLAATTRKKNALRDGAALTVEASDVVKLLRDFGRSDPTRRAMAEWADYASTPVLEVCHEALSRPAAEKARLVAVVEEMLAALPPGTAVKDGEGQAPFGGDHRDP